MPSARRFPPPWTIEEHNDACFIVRDATGQALGYFYFEDEPRRRSATNHQLADPRRSPPHGGELRQAAGDAWQGLKAAAAGWLVKNRRRGNYSGHSLKSPAQSTNSPTLSMTSKTN